MQSLAIVRTEDQVITVGVERVPYGDSTEFAEESAPEVAKGFVARANKDTSAQMAIDEESVHSGSLVSREGVRIVRIRYDVAGAGVTANVAHQNALVVPVDKAQYVITWLSSARSAKTLDSMVDQAALTVHIAHPAESREFHRGEALGKALGSLIPVVVGIVVLIVRLVKRSRRPAVPVASPFVNHPPSAAAG
jgi:hypothetical protein